MFGKLLEKYIGLLIAFVGLAIFLSIGLIQSLIYLIYLLPKDLIVKPFEKLVDTFGLIVFAFPLCSLIIIVGLIIFIRELTSKKVTPEEVTRVR